MTNVVADEKEAPQRFGQQERRGSFLGLTGAQVAVLGSLALICVLALFILQIWAWPVWLVAILIAAITVWRFRGEPVVSMVATQGSYFNRRVKKQHMYTRDVWEQPWQAATVVSKQHGVRAVHARGTLKMPGALGDCQLYEIERAGGFILDRRSRRVAVTLAVQSRAWQLQDPDAQSAAIDGFMSWLNSLEHVTGLVGAVIRIRADRSSSTELADFEIEFGDPNASDKLKEEYALLIKEGAGRAFAFSSALTLTFGLDELSRQIKDSGGGLTGIGHILDQRVQALAEPAAAMRVRVEAWLTAEELEKNVTSAWDPIASARRREEGLTTLEAAPIMGIEEGWSYLRADESVHRVFWVADWPRHQARIGFLEPLLMSGTSSRTVVLQITPRPSHEAMKQAGKELTDMELAAEMRQKMGMRVTRRQEREHEDVDWREKDLVNGHGQASFRGFLIASAASMDDLSRGASDIETASHQVRIVVQPMHGQQAAAFVRTMLPVPMVEEGA